MTPPPPWLTILGIGEDGRDGLSHAARQHLAQAVFVVGGARHLALAAPLQCETLVWPSPIGAALPAILARRGTPVCVLASGDPFFYGVGTMLAARVPAGEFRCLPAPSSFSLAASRLGWPLQACRLVSVHGRDLVRLVPHLHPRAKILCLAWDETTPARVAALLAARGFTAARLHVLEALGGPRERVATALAGDFALPPGDPLNILGIEVEADAGARIVPLGAGLPDEWFENDGQITKREVRAATLAALRRAAARTFGTSVPAPDRWRSSGRCSIRRTGPRRSSAAGAGGAHRPQRRRSSACPRSSSSPAARPKR